MSKSKRGIFLYISDETVPISTCSAVTKITGEETDLYEEKKRFVSWFKVSRVKRHKKIGRRQRIEVKGKGSMIEIKHFEFR